MSADRIDVDGGYVRLVDVLGSDLTIANSARVSYDKQSNKLTQKDKRLIRFLWQNKHYSPFRHCALTFEVKAPMMVKNQWIKHAVASTHLEDQNGWNEVSHRYVAEADEFYVPKKWRAKPENSKQGSGQDLELDTDYSELLRQHIESSKHLYNMALRDGIAAEEARLFLPAYSLYIKWYWTTSLQAVMNFLQLRIAADAQKEIQNYAKAVYELTNKAFPIAIGLMTEETNSALNIE